MSSPGVLRMPRLQARGARQAVAEAARRLVAAGAGQRAVARQPRVVEQRRAVADGRRLARHAVRRVAHRRRRPGADAPGCAARRRCSAARRSGCAPVRRRPAVPPARRPSRQRALHPICSDCVSRCGAAPGPRSSKLSSQRPGMWNISPSARYWPAPRGADAGAVVHAVAVLGHLRIDAQLARQRRAAARAQREVDAEVPAHRHRVGQQLVDQQRPARPRCAACRCPGWSPQASAGAGHGRQQRQQRPPAHCALPAFQNENSASALRQAMRSASGGGRSASQARVQLACSTT